MTNIKEEEDECNFRSTLNQVFQFMKPCMSIKKMVQSNQFITHSPTENLKLNVDLYEDNFFITFKHKQNLILLISTSIPQVPKVGVHEAKPPL